MVRPDAASSAASRWAAAWRWADEPWRVFLLAGALSLSAASVGLSARDWDASRFVVAGRAFTDPASAPADLTVMPGRGYDGQFFYRLALDPLTDRRTDFGITLDNPPYRQQRVLYPALAWLVSFGGHSRLVPWAFLGLNVVGLAGIGLAGAALAGALGRHRLWGLVIASYPGFTMSLLRDTSEIVAVVALLAGLASVLSRRHVLATVSLSAAVLARETTVVVPVAGLAWTVWQWWKWHRETRPTSEAQASRRPGAPLRGLITFGIPVACLAAWQVFLTARWGRAPRGGGEGAIGFPLKTPLSQAWESATDGTAAGLRLSLQILAVLALVAWSLISVRRSSGNSLLTAAFVMSAAVPILLAGDSWREDWAFVRQLSDTVTLGLLVATTGPTAVPLALLAALTVLVLPSL